MKLKINSLTTQVNISLNGATIPVFVFWSTYCKQWNCIEWSTVFYWMEQWNCKHGLFWSTGCHFPAVHFYLLFVCTAGKACPLKWRSHPLFVTVCPNKSIISIASLQQLPFLQSYPSIRWFNIDLLCLPVFYAKHPYL